MQQQDLVKLLIVQLMQTGLQYGRNGECVCSDCSKGVGVGVSVCVCVCVGGCVCGGGGGGRGV